MNLGISGTGIANTITHLTGLMVNVFYSSCDPDVRPACLRPDSRVFSNIKEYMSLGLPAAFMFFLDVIGNNFVDVAAGWISVDSQSA